jgi:hypothetical protein
MHPAPIQGGQPMIRDYRKIAEKIFAEEIRDRCPDVTVEDVENIIRGYDAKIERIKQAFKTKRLVRST